MSRGYKGDQLSLPLVEPILAAAPLVPDTEARRAWFHYRLQHGRLAAAPYLTAPDGNAKLAHTFARPTFSLSLAPASSSRAFNVCPTATSCARVCVGGATCGRAAFDPGIMDGRTLRTRFLGEHPGAALALIRLEALHATYRRAGGRVVGRRRIGLRLNAFSDIRWEYVLPDVLGASYVDAYDYTKHDPGDRAPFGRYRLLYSIDEHDGRADIERKAGAGPIAVVFDMGRHDSTPDRWAGMSVVPGDIDDWRNAQHDPGTVVGLYLKGRAADKARASGFARDPWTEPDIVAPRPRKRSIAVIPCP